MTSSSSCSGNLDFDDGLYAYTNGPKITGGMPDFLAHQLVNYIVEHWQGTLPVDIKAEMDRMHYLNLANLTSAAVCVLFKRNGARPTTSLSDDLCRVLVTKVAARVREDYNEATANGEAPPPLPFDDDQCQPPAAE